MPVNIKCIAIDDEPLALDIIKDYADKVPFLNLLTTFNNAIESIDFIKSNHVDLLFLDIQMDDLTGLQLLNVLKDKPMVIFTTAYDSYAVKGFELNAVDYLLKPISFERFLQSAEKVYDVFNSKNDRSVPGIATVSPTEERSYIFVKTEYRMQRVDLKEILYIEGLKEYLIIKTLSEKVLTLQSFIKMEELLPSLNFVRVHKSYIVALDKIESIERNRIKIHDKLIPIGESYSKAFHGLLEKRKLV
jgi:two-component system, LytTR family, response regulator